VNVTVIVPNALRSAVDGRARINLGLPSKANVGDLLEALFTLYPKLRSHVATEHKTGKQPKHFSLLGAQSQAQKVTIGLHEGQTFYLAAAHSKRLVPPRVPEN
jgi:hypothetical protein